MKLEDILKLYRMAETPEDVVQNGMRLNRLFGLNDLIKENLTSQSIVCELGSHVGASGSLFAFYCKHVYCIDIWENPIAEFYFNQQIKDFINVTKIKERSVNASFIFQNGFFDLVYVDAAHDYKSVKEDIEHWIPKIKKGGILAGHDYSSEGLGNEVIQAINDTIGKPDKIYEDSSWIKQL